MEPFFIFSIYISGVIIGTYIIGRWVEQKSHIIHDTIKSHLR